MIDRIDCPVYLTESYDQLCTCGQHVGPRINRRARTRRVEWLGSCYMTTEAIYENGRLVSLSDLWFSRPSLRIGIWVVSGATINESAFV